LIIRKYTTPSPLGEGWVRGYQGIKEAPIAIGRVRGYLALNGFLFQKPASAT